MNGQMLRAMLWKEWRETRWKWLAFVVAFHLPLIMAGLMVTFRESARFDLLALSDAVAGQVLEVAVVAQSAFLITAGLFLLAFFAVGSVGYELDNHSIFFLFERPVHRWQILLFKYVVGAVQAVTCVGLSLVSSITILYLTMIGAASNVTLEGTSGAFADVIASSLRGAVWTTVLALMVYSATFLFSVLFEKWWIAVIAGAVSLVFMFYHFGEKLFEWVISRATRNPQGEGVNLEFYSQLDPAPIVVMLLVASVFYFAAQYVFARKEMR